MKQHNIHILRLTKSLFTVNYFVDHCLFPCPRPLAIVLSVASEYPFVSSDFSKICCFVCVLLSVNKGNNKITELRTILQREGQNS